VSMSAIATNGPCSRRRWITCGVILNAIIVSVPLAVTGFRSLAELPVLLLLLGSSAFCAMELNQTVLHPEHLLRHDRYQLAAVIGALLLLFVQWAAIVESGSREHVGHGVWVVSGCVLIAVGAWIRSSAIRQLAAGFRSSPETSHLVTSGIYASLRHPSETGLLLAMIGFTLLLSATWTTVVFLPAAYVVAVWRVRLEETELRKTFGADYEAYAVRTSRGL
jgi:protein-S-isoprenylcysteine O-methyltransferase Ste14